MANSLTSFVMVVLIGSVMGFTETEKFKYPWVAGISLKGGNLFSCSGALVHKNWVLTSASCQVDVGDTVHLHRHDMYDFSEVGAEKINVVKVIRHPEFDKESRVNDIALIRFCDSANSKPAQLAESDEEPKVASLLIAGWGRISAVENKIAKTMHQAATKLLPVQHCAAQKTVSSFSLCIARAEEGFSCQEDPGTPLFGNDSTLLGIQSWTAEDCVAPAVYTRVASFSSWIKNTIKEFANLAECVATPRQLQATASSACYPKNSCESCAGSSDGGTAGKYCYWCHTSKTCYTEKDWLEDLNCGLFSFKATECSAHITFSTDTESTNTGSTDSEKAVVPSTADDEKCSGFTSCGGCAGTEYTDSTGQKASCYWCGRQKKCISAAAWENDAVCNDIAFSDNDCMAAVTPDKCNESKTCQKCMNGGFTDFYGVFNSCVWCGDSCVSQARVGSSCPNPLSTCPAQGQSLKSCKQLNWLVAPGSAVCAASKLDGQCSFVLSYPLAKLWCEEKGARLCTADELTNNVALRSGCKLDGERVWTSSACGSGGYTTQAGSGAYLGQTPARCESSSAKYRTRCCADEPNPVVPAPQPKKTCTRLGWGTAPGSPRVCANSVFGKTCITDANFETAQKSCWSLGARLCSQAELEANEAEGSGCKLDNRLVWSSTPCPNGVMVTMGSAQPVSAAKCEPLSSQRAVRCCSDADDGKLAHSCEELGWKPTAGVCADSKVNGQCYKAGSAKSAAEFCSAVGARICSVDELQAGLAANTGCKLDNARVWSSTACAGGFYTTAGDPAFGSAFPKECSPASSSFSARCCAISSKPGVTSGRV